MNQNALRDPKELTAFGWLVFFSILGWLLLFIWIVASLGLALLIIGLIWWARFVAERFAAAYIKTNAVAVWEEQFPEVHGIVVRFSAQLGKNPPTVYVMQHNLWNSVAMKIAGRRMVVLFSGALDSLLLKGNMTQVAWLVGHELGHHFAGHLDTMRHLTVTMGSWFVWVRLWYSRRCEFTCDRYGLACAGSLAESQRAVCNMAVGAQLAPAVNVDAAIAQWDSHKGEFFVKYRNAYSTHPQTLNRLEALKAAADELGIGGCPPPLGRG